MTPTPDARLALPEPAGNFYGVRGDAYQHDYTYDEPAYTASQMHAYADACLAARAPLPEDVERAICALEEVSCDLNYLMGRASRDGHTVGQNLAYRVREKMDAAIATVRALAAANLAGGDGGRLDWLTRHVSGAALMRAGVNYASWSPENVRAAIDAARQQQEKDA